MLDKCHLRLKVVQRMIVINFTKALLSKIKQINCTISSNTFNYSYGSSMISYICSFLSVYLYRWPCALWCFKLFYRNLLIAFINQNVINTIMVYQPRVMFGSHTLTHYLNTLFIYCATSPYFFNPLRGKWLGGWEKKTTLEKESTFFLLNVQLLCLNHVVFISIDSPCCCRQLQSYLDSTVDLNFQILENVYVVGLAEETREKREFNSISFLPVSTQGL